MTFAARQRQLVERLQWGPTRGPRRQALLAELRALVRDELQREIRAQLEAAPPPSAATQSYQRPPRPPYWLDRDDEAHP